MADNLLTSPLNKIPEGLLDFFSIKSMGQYPQRLGDVVQASMDLTPWYSEIASIEGKASDSINVVASTSASDFNVGTADWVANGSFDFAFGTSATTVPPNELWIINEAALRWTMNDVGIIADMAAVVRGNTTPNNTNVLTDSVLLGFNTGVAIGAWGERCLTKKPYFMLPGSSLRLRLYKGTVPAGTLASQFSWRVRRLQR